jgi:hypothetical protein
VLGGTYSFSARAPCHEVSRAWDSISRTHASIAPRRFDCRRAANSSSPRLPLISNCRLQYRLVNGGADARRLAKNAGVTAEEAAKEFTANVIPDVTVIPSGVMGRQPRPGSGLHLLHRRVR